MSDELEQLLSGHLRTRLDPHVGTSAAFFGRRLWRRKVRLWSAMASTSAAAAIAVVWAMSLSRQHPPQQRIAAPASIPAPSRQPSPQVNASLVWRTVDDGTVILQDNTPARRIRRQWVQTVRYFDPQKNVYTQIDRPREQVIYVGLERY